MKVFPWMTMLTVARGFSGGGSRTRLSHSPIMTRWTTTTTTTTTTMALNNMGQSSKPTLVTRHVVGDFWEARMDCWRPTVNDVERISWGKPAKQKGTGSRGVPHRLNEEERFLFDQARRKGFLEIAGSGWRSQRREAPLLNTYRSLCDARGQPSIVLHKSSNGIDDLVMDLSPLRTPEMFHQIAETCRRKFEGTPVLDEGSNPPVESLDSTQEDEADESVIDEVVSSWESRPIYQLPSYCITWQLERSEAKALGKELATLFHTAEGQRAPSKKPVGVKPGKSRKHGGYGIG